MNQFFVIFACLGVIIGCLKVDAFQKWTFHNMRYQTALMMSNEKYPLLNDLMIRAAKGEIVEKTPVWVFRQAGRHLPEYMEYKKDKGKNFLEMLDDPVDVAECTMQPIRRYDLDAAILFSDILVILQALGMEVTMPGGVGIQVPSPIASPQEFYDRIPLQIDVSVQLKHVVDAVKLIKEELKGKVPLIGFSAAPWTLMYYMLGGSSKKNQEVASSWLKENPTESKLIMDLLTNVVIDYLSAQIQAGADMVQVFEAMGMFISEEDFYEWALPSMKTIATTLKAKHPDVPLMVFPRGACYSIVALQQSGYDVVTLDTEAERQSSRALLDQNVSPSAAKWSPGLVISAEGTAGLCKGARGAASIQGNFDVKLLERLPTQATEATEDTEIETVDMRVKTVKAATRDMLTAFGPQKLIANLGEGLTGKEDPIFVGAFIDAVHSISEELI